ncbi:MAG: DHH family phosphoesterase [Anaerolineae bacterium]|jgi:nanoRNase/pAp phosphatase (c-di-AMP/oligoRNAs hydrolase)
MKLKVNLSQVLEPHRGERHLVVLHDYPDPDAIASAFTHRLISAAHGIEVDILYTGKISHQQNIALVRLLGIDLIEYDNSFDLAPYQAAIFVDHQGTTITQIVSALESADVPLLLVVDHHEAQNRVEPEFNERHKAGSTATIYTHYLQQGAVELDTAQKEHVTAATALLHGILTDTGGFIRADADDFQAAAYLSRFRDAEILEQIMKQARSRQAMEIIRRALGDRVTVENFTIAGIGYLRAEDRDAIPEAADFLLTEENVHTAIVYGMLAGDDQDETLVGSLRTAKFTLDPDEFIKEVVGTGSDGRPFGGGKPSAGGFAIPVGFLSGDHGPDFQDLKWQVYDTQIKYKILTKIGVDQKILGQ